MGTQLLTPLNFVINGFPAFLEELLSLFYNSQLLGNTTTHLKNPKMQSRLMVFCNQYLDLSIFETFKNMTYGEVIF